MFLPSFFFASSSSSVSHLRHHRRSPAYHKPAQLLHDIPLLDPRSLQPISVCLSSHRQGFVTFTLQGTIGAFGSSDLANRTESPWLQLNPDLPAIQLHTLCLSIQSRVLTPPPHRVTESLPTTYLALPLQLPSLRFRGPGRLSSVYRSITTPPCDSSWHTPPLRLCGASFHHFIVDLCGFTVHKSSTAASARVLFSRSPLLLRTRTSSTLPVNPTFWHSFHSLEASYTFTPSSLVLTLKSARQPPEPPKAAA